MSNPEYVKSEDRLYKINTDFRVALDCNEIAKNTKISDYERGLAIVYKLFGEDGLESTRIDKLIELGERYISLCNGEGKQNKSHSREDYELDFQKCEGLIRSSFKFDYKYDPYELDYLHWYDFYNDLQNLSTSEFGNCCILNRIISILNKDLSEIKDEKTKKELIEAKKMIKQKYCVEKEVEITEEQNESAEAFYKAIGLL